MAQDRIKEVFRLTTNASSLPSEVLFLVSRREVKSSLKYNLQGDARRVLALLRAPKLTNRDISIFE